MWSFGCILAELYTGYPLFPGENEVEQLACIMEIFSLPPAKILDGAQRIKMSGASRFVRRDLSRLARIGLKAKASEKAHS